jgi:hypothetical protein
MERRQAEHECGQGEETHGVIVANASRCRPRPTLASTPVPARRVSSSELACSAAKRVRRLNRRQGQAQLAASVIRLTHRLLVSSGGNIISLSRARIPDRAYSCVSYRSFRRVKGLTIRSSRSTSAGDVGRPRPRSGWRPLSVPSRTPTT